MKKRFLLLVVFFTLLNVKAQDFVLGLNVGLPLGDIKDSYTLNIGGDISYLWEVSELFNAGVSAGYSHFLGDSIEGFDIEDAGFLPIAAAGRFNVTEDFAVGTDLGYAIGISPDGNDGGFYYAPKVQYAVSQSIDIVLAYKGISVDGGTFSTINLGIEFGLQN